MARADRSGTREALIGDLLEELAHGRSRWWLCHQLVGLYWSAFAAHARHHARLTPCAVALALSVVLLGGVSITSADNVLEAWLGFYLVAGTVSLFAHMMARAQVDVRL
ncbi:MAG: hypothetical protein LAO77_18100 [Acidobacteriia bacterium]|nr:hypothetical protein [Terriglobia bacterium]